MDKAIEAAARSLCRSDCEDLKTIGTFKCEYDGHCIYWDKYVPDAEAAIAACEATKRDEEQRAGGEDPN